MGLTGAHLLVLLVLLVLVAAAAAGVSVLVRKAVAAGAREGRRTTGEE